MIEYNDDFTHVSYFRAPYISCPIFFRSIIQDVIDTLWHILSQLEPNYLDDLPPQRLLELYDLFNRLKVHLKKDERAFETSAGNAEN